MDLSTIGKTLATAKYEMHLLSPDGFPLYATEVDGVPDLTTTPNDRPVIWELASRDSPEFKRGQAALFNWQQKQGRKQAKFNEANQKTIETVAAGVTGWRNTIWDGKNLEFTLDNLLMVLAGYRPGMEQADEAIADRGNFYRSA